MEQRSLGPLNVSAIGFGAMPLSVLGRPDEADATQVIHAALEAGVTLIDTADVYCMDDRDIGHNERLINKALAQWPDRDQVVVATKGGLERPQGAWTLNGHPEHLAQACERSLTALGTDCIDVYQIHAPDSEVPWADTIGTVARLREQGKVRHVGLSNVSLKEVDEALSLCPIVSVQNRLNPFDLGSLMAGVVEGCAQRGIAFLAYSPVGGRQKNSVAQSPHLNEIARGYDVSPFQVALAWLLTKGPNIIPIPGASKAASVESSAASADITLREADILALDAAFGADEQI